MKPDPRRDGTLRVECQFASRRPWVPSRRRLGDWAAAAWEGAGPRARRVVLAGGGPATVCVRVVGPRESRRLNRDFRGSDRPTNVLSFPSSATERELCGALGDLVVCATVVAREAREQRKPRSAHWAHMIAHGVLHLAGFDHERAGQARVMERREVAILAAFGYQNPYHRRTAGGT